MDKRKIKIAILAFASLLMGSSITTGILAEISMHYSEVDQSIISMVLTLPFLLGMIFSLVAGPLSRRISNKSLVVFSLFAMLTAATLSFSFGGVSIYVLIISSALFGIGQGMMSTLSMALIADHFEGEKRSSLMGLQSSFVNFGGMVISFIAALLAGIYWGYAYLVHILIIPIIFLVIRNLPKDKPIKQTLSSTQEKGKLNSSVFLNCFTVFFFGFFIFVFQANVAFFIATNQLGDATTAGIANSIFVTAGGLTGIAYGRISRIFRGYMIPVGIAVSALGLLQLFTFGNLISIFIAGACGGYGLTSIMPTALFNVSVAVKPALSATAIALVNCATNIGIFLSPLIINAISNLISDGDISIRFLIGAIGLIAVAIIYVLGNAKIDKTSDVKNT